MSDKEIVIKDACILFDLVDLGLLDVFFQIEVSAFTTSQVVAEITDDQQWKVISMYINNGKLQVDNEGDYEVISRIYDEHPGLSYPDSSVLELALRKNAIIYSSDGRLRKISIKKGLTVRGVIWIIEELYRREIINKEVAISKLELYGTVNQWAPLKEINNLISKILNQ